MINILLLNRNVYVVLTFLFMMFCSINAFAKTVSYGDSTLNLLLINYYENSSSFNIVLIVNDFDTEFSEFDDIDSLLIYLRDNKKAKMVLNRFEKDEVCSCCWNGVYDINNIECVDSSISYLELFFRNQNSFIGFITNKSYKMLKFRKNLSMDIYMVRLNSKVCECFIFDYNVPFSSRFDKFYILIPKL